MAYQQGYNLWVKDVNAAGGILGRQVKLTILDDKSVTQRINGRVFELHYTGSHLHVVVLRDNGATYWVVNTLLDSLSNETMLAIAKGLKPLAAAK